MDHHIKQFYRKAFDDSPRGHYHSVIALHQEPDISWKEITEKVPNLNRGWFELAHLKSQDRIEFLRDFWLSKLPYRAGLNKFLNRFFGALDDIGIFVTQKKFDDPFGSSLVYSLKEDKGFFCGMPPITDKDLTALQRYFREFILPIDYVAFLQIHDGFFKTTDTTGIISSTDMAKTYEKLQQMQLEPILTSKKSYVDPKTLIPFYESFGMPYYQCFWADWYPEQEMGNVYYSVGAKAISDVYGGKSSVETMAFPTFIDWLMFYLEQII